MKVFQEITNWEWPNHVYFLSDSKDKMYAYVNPKTGIIEEVKKPYRFSSSGRKFKEIPNSWGFSPREDPIPVGREFKVTGSKGDVYTVTENLGEWSCSCTGFKYHSKCKHIDKVNQ